MQPTAPWMELFPALGRLPADIVAKLAADSSVVALPEGSRIYGPGRAPQAYLMLLDGTVRVQQVSESGREIVLYRVSAGESCALTTACLMGYEDYPAEAVAETQVRAVAIGREDPGLMHQAGRVAPVDDRDFLARDAGRQHQHVVEVADA